MAGPAAAEQVVFLTFEDLLPRQGALDDLGYWYAYHDGTAQYIVSTDDNGSISIPLATGPGPLTVELEAEVVASGETGGIGLFCCRSETDGRRLGFIVVGDGIEIWEHSPEGSTRRSMSLGGTVSEPDGPISVTMVDGETGFSIFVDGENVTSLSQSQFPKGLTGIYLRGPGVFVIRGVSVSYSEDEEAKSVEVLPQSAAEDPVE